MMRLRRSSGFEQGSWLVPYADNDMGASMTAWFHASRRLPAGKKDVSDLRRPLASGARRQPDRRREPQVHGSPHLARTLIARDLVDEHRLLIYPVFLGAGGRLFDRPGLEGALRLADTETSGSGVVVLTDEPVVAPQLGSFELAPEPEQHRILRRGCLDARRGAILG